MSNVNTLVRRYKKLDTDQRIGRDEQVSILKELRRTRVDGSVLSFSQIGDLVGMSGQAVAQQLNRAKK